MTYEDSPVAAVALFQLGVQSHGDEIFPAKELAELTIYTFL